METVGLSLLILVLLLLFFWSFRAKSGRTGALRPMPGLVELPTLVGRAAETGRAIHVSLGVAGLGGAATSETWAGFNVLEYVAGQAAAFGAPLVVTVADSTVLPVAQDALRRAYKHHGELEAFDSTHVRLVSTDPTAYATGVMGMLNRETWTANIMIGSFGDEFLFMGDTGAERGVRQVAGAADPRTLPWIYASADQPLLGEEMFAGGAFSSRLPIQIGSLLTQDTARWLLAGAIVVIAIVRWFGWGL